MVTKSLADAVHTEVSVPAALWAAASLLARARSASNVARSVEHNRGERGNQTVDLHGAFGELLLQRILRDQVRDSETAQQYMSDNMFVASGGAGLGNSPDLRFDEAGVLVGIDAKTFDCSPHKKYFAIADSKHTGLRGQATFYFAAIAPPNGRRAVLTGLIPYNDVDTWTLGHLRPGGNPSRNLPINDFIAQYCPPSTSIMTLRGAVYDPLAITRLAKTPTLRSYLIKLIPSIEVAL